MTDPGTNEFPRERDRPADRSPVRRFAFPFVAFAAALATGAIIVELVLRLFWAERFGPSRLFDERNLHYVHDVELGWMPVPGAAGVVTGSRRFEVRNNSLGFRDPEPPIDGDTRPRILFFGDSFLWGYDVDEGQRVTDLLRARRPSWTIVNCGVSGFGTDQELLLFRRHAGRLRPSVVVLLVNSRNDHQDVSTNLVYWGYGKPYFVEENRRLEVRGVPVPEGPRYFAARHERLVRSSYLVRAVLQLWMRKHLERETRWTEVTVGRIVREMRDVLAAGGVPLLVGLIDPDPELEASLRRDGISFLSLANDLRLPESAGHWSPEGHRDAADRLEPEIARLLESLGGKAGIGLQEPGESGRR